MLDRFPARRFVARRWVAHRLVTRMAATLFSTIVAVISTVPAHADTTSTQAVEMLDVDGNGTVDALTDGLLLMRFMFGLRGQPLIQNAIGPNATRNTSAQIEAYLSSLYTTPPAGGGGGGG